jgi:hypothetical protein
MMVCYYDEMNPCLSKGNELGVLAQRVLQDEPVILRLALEFIFSIKTEV